MSACVNCKHRPATTSGGLCDNAVCGDELAVARRHATQYARPATVAATYTVTSPAGAKDRCVQCGVMPAQYTAPVAGAGHGETVGLCSAMCRTEYNKAPLLQEHIGSVLERWRYGLRTRQVAEEIIAMMDAASQWDRVGAVNYADFLTTTGYYSLLHQMLTRDGQRNLSLDRYREFAAEVRNGVDKSSDSQLVRLEVPESTTYSAGALSGSVATMYKRMWRAQRAVNLFRRADVGAYAGRIYRDIMMLRNDKDDVKAAIDAVFSAENLAAAVRVHSDNLRASKPVAASYADALAPHPELLDELDMLHELDDIDAPFGGLARGAKALATQGVKAVTGKGAAAVATTAGAVADRMQRVELGQYSMAQLAKNIEPLLAQYVWLSNNWPGAAEADNLSWSTERAAYYEWAASLRLIIEAREAGMTPGSVVDRFSALRNIVANVAANTRVDPRPAPIPVEMPVDCVDYTQLGRNMYGLFVASADPTRKEKLMKDIEKLQTDMSRKYRPLYSRSFMVALFSELVNVVQTYLPTLAV